MAKLAAGAAKKLKCFLRHRAKSPHSIKPIQMSSTIMMPNTIDTTIRGMCEDAVAQAVATLSERHGFDADEALRDLNLGDLKIVRKRGPSPTGEKKTKSKVKSDKPKVKRGKTGYLLYADSVRPAVKAELEAELDEGAKLKPQATVSEIAKRWKGETEEVRADWNEQAKELNSAASSPQASDTESVADSDAPKPVVAKKATKKAEKAAASDEKPKAKKAPTGYLLYAAAIRAAVKAEMQAALPEGEKLKPQATVAEIAKRWKAETDEVRAEWNEQAKDGSASGEATE